MAKNQPIDKWRIGVTVASSDPNENTSSAFVQFSLPIKTPLISANELISNQSKISNRSLVIESDVRKFSSLLQSLEMIRLQMNTSGME